MKLYDAKMLDTMQCQAKGCDHSAHDKQMFFHGRCHMAAPVHVSYERGSGVLTLTCATCGQEVANIAVR